MAYPSPSGDRLWSGLIDQPIYTLNPEGGVVQQQVEQIRSWCPDAESQLRFGNRLFAWAVQQILIGKSCSLRTTSQLHALRYLIEHAP
jgi:hypothetical protein